jgi:hypothetical protein
MRPDKLLFQNFELDIFTFAKLQCEKRAEMDRTPALHRANIRVRFVAESAVFQQ